MIFSVFRISINSSNLIYYFLNLIFLLHLFLFFYSLLIFIFILFFILFFQFNLWLNRSISLICIIIIIFGLFWYKIFNIYIHIDYFSFCNDYCSVSISILFLITKIFRFKFIFLHIHNFIIKNFRFTFNLRFWRC